MPLAFHKLFKGGEILGVWKLTETLEDLHHITSQVFPYSENEVHPERARQWLGVRALVQKIFPTKYNVAIGYKDNKPTFPEGYISISHTLKYTTVFFSPTSECGVDIESTERDFQSVKTRFLSPTEQARLISGKDKELALYWSAKEALYKIDNRCIDFANTIEVMPVQAIRREGNIVVKNLLSNQAIRLYYEQLDEYFLVYGSLLGILVDFGKTSTP